MQHQATKNILQAAAVLLSILSSAGALAQTTAPLGPGASGGIGSGGGGGGTGTVSPATAGQVAVYSGSTTVTGYAGLTYADPGQLSLALGTITTNLRALSITGTWNNAGTTFDAPLFMNIINTASASSSLLADLQVSSSSIWKIGVSGTEQLGSSISYLSGGTGTVTPFSIVPTVSFAGSLGAYTTAAEHMLSNNWASQNVLSLWNKNSSGISSATFLSAAAGAEFGAIGFSNSPSGSFFGQRYFIEASGYGLFTGSPTFTNGSAVILGTNSFVPTNPVVFTGGSLPTPLVAGQIYYVIATGLSSSQFEVSATVGGSAVTMTGSGSGTVGSAPAQFMIAQTGYIGTTYSNFFRALFDSNGDVSIGGLGDGHPAIYMYYNGNFVINSGTVDKLDYNIGRSNGWASYAPIQVTSNGTFSGGSDSNDVAMFTGNFYAQFHLYAQTTGVDGYVTTNASGHNAWGGGPSTAGMNIFTPSSYPIRLATNDTLALTLDTSQNAIFAGQIVAANMTQSAAAQTGTVCWAAAGLTYDATLGCLTSTRLIKHDIRPLDNALDRVLAMKPSTFYFNDDRAHGAEQIGLIAEDVADVDQRLVGYGDNGLPRGWSQSGMIAELVGAVKELKGDNDNLRAEVEALRRSIAP